ncbi:histidine kinase [Dyadobacter sp. CY261]|uniref:two-component regulator propeller domain-containing protein n=1 Tax=Dyadobacter sp. CY261 TaxID=2907203 RepID=UPI001F2A5DAE|nr:two-component regulator propeller domain-containing protein [Dyadobacter sp. CY261]MCF0069813.1 histidine kinase [Dyadobacter sp. CY261]
MRLTGFVMFIFLLGREAGAQMPVLTLEHLTTKEGMPSNDVWCLNKDRKGFLWIGTGRNLCRYDGYNFLRLDSLQLGYCSGISTDSKGDLYTSVDTRGITRIDRNTMEVTTLVHNNYDDEETGNDLHEQGTVDSYDQMWVCDYTSVQRYDIVKKKLHRYTFKGAGDGGDVYQYASFFEDHQRVLWIVSELGLYYYDRKGDKLVCVLGPEAIYPENRIAIRLSRGSQDSAGDLWIGGYEYGLVKYTPATHRFSVRKAGFEQNNVVCARESRDENGRKLLFVGTNDGISVYYPERKALYHLPEFYNRGIRVKDMYDDKENGILWIGTSEGVFKYRYHNVGIRTVAIPPEVVRLPVQVTSIQPAEKGSYWLGLSHSGVLHWEPSANSFRLHRYEKKEAFGDKVRVIGEQAFVFTDKGIFIGNAATDRFQPWHTGTQLFRNTDFRDGLLDRKGRLWIANLNEGLKVIDPSTNRELHLWKAGEGRKLVNQSYIKAIRETPDGRIWIATCSRGLFFFDEEKGLFINIGDLPLNKGKRLGGECINAIQVAPDGSVLVASWGGVSRVASTGLIRDSFDFNSSSLKDTYCSNIAETPDGRLWFSTNEGIHIADPKTRAIRYLTTIEGLRSNAPVGFYYNAPGELLLGYVNMLNVLNVNLLGGNVRSPRIMLGAVEVKGKKLFQDTANEIVLQPDENSVSFSFTTLNFEPSSQNNYSYQLEGYEEDWVNMGNEHAVSFANLPASSYTLRVRSTNTYGITSKKPLVIRLVIRPYFTSTWFFRVLIGLTIAGLIVVMMRWRVSTLHERDRLDLQITEWKLKALQSQMNPHFLFNSLNSVQNYLLTNRGVEGAKYLSKFSKLVRQIMENSNYQYLSFEKIIDTLRLYVEIESFRFNHEFTYAFDIEENDLLLDAQLPPMLLQPYVENAIWHGLMPKEGEKKLTITARLNDRHIICTIGDNGVGRNFSPRKEGHISRGEEMTRGIFEALRHKDSEAKIELIDLFDDQNKPAGTLVKMIIPIENI